MSVVVLPFQPGAIDSFSTPLLGVTYVFDVHWNARDKAYYVHISDVNQETIVASVKVVLGTFLGRTAYRVPPFSGGVFVAVDTSKGEKEAGFDDLSGRVLVKYIPIEDLLANMAARDLTATSAGGEADAIPPGLDDGLDLPLIG